MSTRRGASSARASALNNGIASKNDDEQNKRALDTQPINSIVGSHEDSIQSMETKLQGKTRS